MSGDTPKRDIKSHKLFEIATEYARFGPSMYVLS